jgi:hypothetical protein
MSNITYDVTYQEARNRLTVAFRAILAIPHMVVSTVWGYFVQILAFVQWFIILFTGKRNEGIWNLQQAYLGYYARVMGYISLLFDEYPGFGTDPGNVPARSEISYEEPANRLTNALRFLWIIPAAIIYIFVAIASMVVLLISWFAIVITGQHPRGMWDFLLKSLRMSLQLQAYSLLMTDDYPKFGEGAMASGYGGSPAPSGAFVPPPSPQPG